MDGVELHIYWYVRYGETAFYQKVEKRHKFYTRATQIIIFSAAFLSQYRYE